MPMFRKRPVVIEARRLPAESELDSNVASTEVLSIRAWCGGYKVDPPMDGVAFSIPTLEGKMWAVYGDWIIKGVKGEFYPCKHDIFATTYEFVGY